MSILSLPECRTLISSREESRPGGKGGVTAQKLLRHNPGHRINYGALEEPRRFLYGLYSDSSETSIK